MPSIFVLWFFPITVAFFYPSLIIYSIYWSPLIQPSLSWATCIIRSPFGLFYMYKVVSSQRILSKHNELQLTLSQPAVGLAYETVSNFRKRFFTFTFHHVKIWQKRQENIWQEKYMTRKLSKDLVSEKQFSNLTNYFTRRYCCLMTAPNVPKIWIYLKLQIQIKDSRALIIQIWSFVSPVTSIV